MKIDDVDQFIIQSVLHGTRWPMRHGAVLHVQPPWDWQAQAANIGTAYGDQLELALEAGNTIQVARLIARMSIDIKQRTQPPGEADNTFDILGMIVSGLFRSETWNSMKREGAARRRLDAALENDNEAELSACILDALGVHPIRRLPSFVARWIRNGWVSLTRRIGALLGKVIGYPGSRGPGSRA